VGFDFLGTPFTRRGQRRPLQQREATMAGTMRKLLISTIATKVIQEARKPQNQAKLKKAFADFQAKRSAGKRPGGTGRY
jgi:hypothetical protein